MSAVNVRVQMSTTALTLRTRSRVAEFTPAIMEAERLSGLAMVKRARALSQGWLRTRDIRRMKPRPYSIGGNPPVDPAIINRQTGNLQWRWQSRVTKQQDSVQITLWNTARYAKYMIGTFKMQPRPILEAVFRLEQGARLERLKGARETVLKSK